MLINEDDDDDDDHKVDHNDDNYDEIKLKSACLNLIKYLKSINFKISNLFFRSPRKKLLLLNSDDEDCDEIK